MQVVVRPGGHPAVLDVTIRQFALARGHVFLLTELGLGRQWLGLAHRTQAPRAVPRMEYCCVLG